jgi:4-alpha-glucanotransferase/alpha-amylase
MPCGFGQDLDLSGCTGLTLDDRALAGGIGIETSAPVAVKARPLCTVSQSEGGLEKIMQSACVTLSWLVPEEGSELIVTLKPYGDVSRDILPPAGISPLRRWFAAARALRTRQPRS